MQKEGRSIGCQVELDSVRRSFRLGFRGPSSASPRCQMAVLTPGRPAQMSDHLSATLGRRQALGAQHQPQSFSLSQTASLIVSRSDARCKACSRSAPLHSIKPGMASQELAPFTDQ